MCRSAFSFVSKEGISRVANPPLPIISVFYLSTPITVVSGFGGVAGAEAEAESQVIEV